MAVAIKNLTQRPIFVSLNSGTELRLSPREVAADIHDVELKDNAKVEKLLRQRAIAVERGDDTPGDKREDAAAEEKKKGRTGRTSREVE
jgi:hypothetical protein